MENGDPKQRIKLFSFSIDLQVEKKTLIKPTAGFKPELGQKRKPAAGSNRKPVIQVQYRPVYCFEYPLG
jgi:hypothetical protein